MKRRIFSLGLSLALVAGLIAPARAAQAEPARQLLPALAAVLELEPSAPLRAQTAAVSFTLASVLSGVERAPSLPQTPEVPDTLAAYQGEILRLVNAERTKAGVDPLTLNATLCTAAQLRAQELPTQFAHTRPDGTQCFTVLDQVGQNYRTAGENIAAGQTSPAQVVSDWMNSPGHRRNILDASFTQLGVGYVQTDSGYGEYWVQLFIG